MCKTKEKFPFEAQDVTKAINIEIPQVFIQITNLKEMSRRETWQLSFTRINFRYANLCGMTA